MRRRMCRWVVLLACLLTLAGCWDARELNQLALVMAVGIDKAEEAGRFQVSIQVARPGSGRGGKGGGAGSASTEPVYIATADGDTLFAAIRNLAQFTSRRIMWAHNNVVVIGESLAREDITPVIDFFTRNQELRMRTWVVVALGTDARSIVAAKTGLEDVPANSISAIMRHASLPGESVRSDVSMVADAFMTRDLNPVISAVVLAPHLASGPEKVEGEHGQGLQVTLRGIALFDGPRLVGAVHSGRGRGLLWLRAEMKNAVITVPCPGAPGRGMAVELRAPKTSARPEFRGSSPVMRVRVETDGWLNEQDCETPQVNALELKRMVEEAVGRKVRDDMTDALAYLQGEIGVDAVDYGRRFHLEYPAWWRANRQQWKEIFPHVKTEVEVRARITKMGIYARPMQPQFP